MSGRMKSVIIKEWDGTGHECATYQTSTEGSISVMAKSSEPYAFDVIRFLKSAFLPAGYPLSVSPDYLSYQIYNALQAFCSSLAGLIASRAVLEGHGVGNASASATDALLLTIFQDIFSRVTTILSAYYFGTLLFPEAKTYRFLADIFNDAAFVLDTLSPHLASFTLSSSPLSYRGLALCLSGGFRALCGVVAGGSKAALTMHFAQPMDTNAPGDIGDLSAKDGSKETVLALFGMLCGSVLVPYVHGAYATYGTLAVLIIAHLIINYAGVRSVVFRSLNRQRTSVLWAAYRGAGPTKGGPSVRALTPPQVASKEYIFASPSALLYPAAEGDRHVSGHCTTGVSLSTILNARLPRWTDRLPWGPHRQGQEVPHLDEVSFTKLLAMHAEDKYVLWPADGSPLYIPHIVVVLKEGHGPLDHIRAWLHATEMALCLRRCAQSLGHDAVFEAIRESKDIIEGHFISFMESIKREGWSLDAAGGGLLAGAPRTIRVEEVDRKTR